jgi:hypothetical protein
MNGRNAMSKQTRLTALERDVIRNIVRSEYGDTLEDPVWSFSACGTKALAGAAGSLGRKGLVKSEGDGSRDNDYTIRLTEAGILAWEAMGEARPEDKQRPEIQG